MFTPEDREAFRARLIEMAKADERLLAAALVGSSAAGGDRWSDLDLTFSVGDGFTVPEVLADWTTAVIQEFGAAVLFDLPLKSTIYRVFLFPGALQVDLSFSPVAEFGARGPRFQLLYGEAAEQTWLGPASAEHAFGLAVHHAVRSHICIERGRCWQAEYWIHELRNEALSLACRRLGLEPRNGRGFDDLPPEVTAAYADSFAGDLSPATLRRALAAAADGLLQEGDFVSETAAMVRPMLDALLHPAAIG